MTTEVRKNFFDIEVARDSTPKSAFQKLKEQKDFSTLVIEKNTPADLVRAALKHSRNVLTSLTLSGSWEDSEFRTFTPFMDSVTSLSLVDSTFSDEAFDEAFVSKVSHENPFESTLATYVEEDEWDKVPFIPQPRPPIYTDLSFSTTYNQISDLNSESWELPSLEPEKVIQNPKKEKKSLIVNCPKLSALMIVNPTRISGEVLHKLLPLKEQLTSLTLIGWKQTPSVEVIRSLFPNLETLVIK